MADIEIFGTLVNKTESGKIAYAQQVWHNGKSKSVQQLLDEIEAGLIEASVDNVTFLDESVSPAVPVKANVRFFSDSRVIEITEENGTTHLIDLDEFTNDFSDEFSEDFGSSRISDYQLKEDADIEVEGENTVVGALNSLNKKIGDIPTPAESHFKYSVSLAELLAIQDAEESDAYEVYGGYNDDGTFSWDDFVYGNQVIKASTIFVYSNGAWIATSERPNYTGVVKVSNRPSSLSFIESLYPQTSFKDLYGEGKAGMILAKVSNWQLDDEGVYQGLFAEKGTAGQRYYTKSNKAYIIVPFANSHEENGETVYAGGAMSPADYEAFKGLVAGSGIVTYTFQGGTNSFTVTPSDTGVAQTVSVTPSIVTDATPIADSTKPVQSGGVKKALDDKSNIGHKHSASDITSGVLAVEKGGTGQASLEQACNSLITSLRTDTSQNTVPTDGDYFVSQFIGGTYDTYFRRPMSSLWAYIKSKADLVYATISHTHTVSDITDMPAIPDISSLATKSLSNLATGAGANMTAAMAKSNVEALIDKLDVDSNNVPSLLSTNYFVMATSSGSAEKVQANKVVDKIAADVEDSLNTVFVQKKYCNEIVADIFAEIESITSGDLIFTSRDPSGNIPYDIDLTANGWHIGISVAYARVSDNFSFYSLYDSQTAIQIQDGCMIVAIQNKYLNSSTQNEELQNYERFIRCLSSTKMLFYNSQTGRMENILDYVSAISGLIRGNTTDYNNCIMLVSKKLSDFGISTMFSDNTGKSFLHVIMEGRPQNTWD